MSDAWEKTIKDAPASGWEDTIQEDQKIGQVEAALRGGAQGLSFGLEDEAVGGLQALKNTMFGDESFSNIKQAYEKAVSAEREKNAQAQTQNPMTYGASEFGAGLLLPLGAAGKAVKGAGELSSLAKVLAASKAGAKSGAALGGLTAFGKSEGQEGESAGDAAMRLGTATAKGAGIGAAFGGGLAGLGATVGAGLNKLGKGSGAVGTTAYAIERGLEGESLVNINKQADKLYALMEQHGEDTIAPGVKKIMDKMSAIQQKAKQNPEILEQASNDIFDAARELEFAVGGIRNREVQNEARHLIGTVDDMLLGLPTKVGKTIERPNSMPGATGGDLMNLEQRLGELRQQGKYETSDIRKGVKKLDELVSGKVDEVIPEYAPIRQNYSEMKQGFDVLGIPENEIMQITPEGFKRLNPDAAKKILGQFRKQADGGIGGKIAEKNLEQSFDLMKKAGIEGVDEMKASLLAKAKDYNVAEYIADASSIPKPGGLGAYMGRGAAGLGNIGGVMAAPLIKGANAVGQRAIPRALGAEVARTEGGSQPNVTEDFSRTIYTMDNSQLDNMAQSLKQNPGMAYMGDRLQNAIQTGNHKQKNALLFSIAQNPEMRKYLSK